MSKNLLQGESGQQQIAGIGSYVYVIWQDNSTGTENTWFTASNNTGQNFNYIPPTNLAAIACTGCSSSRPSANPQIAVSSNNVYVVWWEYTNTQATRWDVFYAFSNNNGKIFTTTNLSGTTAGSDPVIAVAGNDVYVAWLDSSNGDNVFLKASTSGGTIGSFGANQNLSNLASGSGLSASLERITAVGSSVYVVWTRVTFPIPKDVFFTYSKNNGMVGNFSIPVNLSQNLASTNAVLAAAGTNVYVAWANVTGTQRVVALRSSANNGASFAPVLYLSATAGNSPSPQLAAGGTNVYLAWQDQNSNNNVFFTFSSNKANPGSFVSPVNLSNDANSQLIVPTLAASGNNTYVAWQDDSLGNPVNDEILFRAGTPAIILPPTAAPSSFNSFENQPVTLLLTGSDPQGLPLVFSPVTGPGHGTLGSITQLAPNMAKVTYTPSLNYLGPDSFTFKVNNGSFDSSPNTVSITVIATGASGGGRWSD